MTNTNELPPSVDHNREEEIAALRSQLYQRDMQMARLHRHILELEQQLAHAERKLVRQSAMMSEDKPLQQIEGEPKRRWFSDSDFDLIVWLEHETPPALPDGSVKADVKSQPSGMVRKLRALYRAKPPDEHLNRIIGFQLCYDKTGVERALTWHEATGYSHYRIDSGEEGSKSKQTPILVADSDFAAEAVAALFKHHSAEINPAIARFVYEKIIQYHR